MKTMLKAAALGAALVAAPTLVASTAVAQAAAGQGVAIVDLGAAVGQSRAYQTASQQIQTTFATQIAAFNARNTALNAELTPLRTELQTLQNNPATPQATLQQKATALQTRVRAAQTELDRLALPFARPLAYAREQVTAKLEQALRAAMTAKRVNLVINPEAAVLSLPAGDLTPDVVTQLNTLVTTVQTTPPANWQPGQAAVAPTTTPTTPPPANSGR